MSTKQGKAKRKKDIKGPRAYSSHSPKRTTKRKDENCYNEKTPNRTSAEHKGNPKPRMTAENPQEGLADTRAEVHQSGRKRAPSASA